MGKTKVTLTKLKFTPVPRRAPGRPPKGARRLKESIDRDYYGRYSKDCVKWLEAYCDEDATNPNGAPRISKCDHGLYHSAHCELCNYAAWADVSPVRKRKPNQFARQYPQISPREDRFRWRGGEEIVGYIHTGDNDDIGIRAKRCAASMEGAHDGDGARGKKKERRTHPSLPQAWMPEADFEIGSVPDNRVSVSEEEIDGVTNHAADFLPVSRRLRLDYVALVRPNFRGLSGTLPAVWRPAVVSAKMTSECNATWEEYQAFCKANQNATAVSCRFFQCMTAAQKSRLFESAPKETVYEICEPCGGKCKRPISHSWPTVQSIRYQKTGHGTFGSVHARSGGVLNCQKKRSWREKLNLSFEAYIRNMFGLTGLEKDYKFPRIDHGLSPKLHHSRLCLLDRFTMMLDEYGPPRIGFAAEHQVLQCEFPSPQEAPLWDLEEVWKGVERKYTWPDYKDPRIVYRPYETRSGLRVTVITRSEVVLPCPLKEWPEDFLRWAARHHELRPVGDARYADLVLDRDEYVREDLDAKIDLYRYGYRTEQAAMESEGYPNIDGEDFLPVTPSDLLLLHFLQPKVTAEKTKHALWRALARLREIQGRRARVLEIPQGSGEANPAVHERTEPVRWCTPRVLQPTRPVGYWDVWSTVPMGHGDALIDLRDVLYHDQAPVITSGLIRQGKHRPVQLSKRQKRDRRCEDLRKTADSVIVSC